MDPKINDRQLVVLRWIADGCPEGHWPKDDFTYKLSAKALKSRHLVTIRGHGPTWQATTTDAGSHYLEHGSYPPGHHLAPKAAKAAPREVEPTESETRTSRRRRAITPSGEPEAPNNWAIESPNQLQRRGRGVLTEETPAHPWNDRILVSVKEAAWLLSLSERMIRDAAVIGDIDRVFIGVGTTHYRIVYNSLLAWVNSLPTEPVRSRW